jgi:hypothetical protein
MATGTKTFKGLAVPLSGESEILQETLGTDILTLRGVASQSADFLVCRNNSLTEKFVVDVNGKVTTAGGVTIPTDKYLGWPSPVGTAPITGLTEGDLFVTMKVSTPQIGVCYSTASNAIMYFTADTKTFGRTTG